MPRRIGYRRILKLVYNKKDIIVATIRQVMVLRVLKCCGNKPKHHMTAALCIRRGRGRNTQIQRRDFINEQSIIHACMHACMNRTFHLNTGLPAHTCSDSCMTRGGGGGSKTYCEVYTWIINFSFSSQYSKYVQLL